MNALQTTTVVADLRTNMVPLLFLYFKAIPL